MTKPVAAGLSRRLGLQRSSVKPQQRGKTRWLHKTDRPELAGGEIPERLETAHQLGADYTAFPVEQAQKVGGVGSGC